MDKLIEFTFDFFGHVIPGLIIFIALSLLFLDVSSFEEILCQAESIETNKIPVILLPSYVFGFAANPIGKFLYIAVGKRIWKQKIVNHVDMFISDKYVMVREDSPVNFKYIEKWNIYCAMAHNLAVGFLILFLVVLTKLNFNNAEYLNSWIIIGIGSLMLFFVLIERAVIFSTWATHDLNAAVKKISEKEQP
jgi:hypothetical protein